MVDGRTSQSFWIVLLGSMIIGPSLQAQELRLEPKIHAEERTIELGRVKQGDKPSGKFKLENNGAGELHIDRIQAGCGCTVLQNLSDEQRTLAPGDSIEFEAMFDTKGRHGKQRKSVTVYSNDPFEPQLQLFLTCEITTPVEIQVNDRSSRFLRLSKAQPGTKLDDVIDVLPTDPNKSLIVDSIELPDTTLAFESEPLEKDSRSGTRIKLRVAPDAKLGYQVATRLSVRGTLDGEAVSDELRINGEIVGALEYTPVVLRELNPKLHGSTLQPITVRSLVDRPFKIEGIDSGPYLEGSITSRPDDTEHTIMLKVKDDAPDGPFGTNVDVYTSCAEQPFIRIPAFVMVRPRVETVPPQVVLRRGADKDAPSAIVRLENSAGAPLTLKAVACESPYVTAREIDPPARQSASAKHIEVLLSKDAPAGRFVANVHVTTNLKEAAVVDVPVTLVIE